MKNTMLHLYIAAVPQLHSKRHLLFWILRNGLIMKRMIRGQKRAEGAFEFNEELEGIDAKLILFEKIPIYNL